MSPAAFSQRIASLEEHLGQELFARTTRRVALTEVGTRMIPLAERLLRQSVHLQHEVRGQEVMPFELTIGTRFELGLSWLVPGLDALTALCPERTLHLVFGDGDDMGERVRTHQVDAAITSSRKLPPRSSFSVLHAEEYVLVGGADWLRAHPLGSSADASSHILHDIGPTRPLLRYFLEGREDSASWSFASDHYLGTIAAIRQRILGGHGVAVLPAYFVSRDIQEGRLTCVEPDSTGPPVLASDAFRLVWLSDHPLVDRLAELAEQLRTIPLG